MRGEDHSPRIQPCGYRQRGEGEKLAVLMDDFKNKNALETLNVFIANGKLPEFISTEHDYNGIQRIVFTWKDGSWLKTHFRACIYISTLKRFLDFWATCMPGTNLNVKDPKRNKRGDT